jgi:hypothetical protein
MDEEDNADELMPEIIEATQNEITSEEEESEQEDIIEPKQHIQSNDIFEDSNNNNENDENIEEKPIEPLFVKKVKNETEPNENKTQVEFIETVKKNIKGSANENSQKRKKQLEHLRMMRERKKQLAEERTQQQEPKTKKERPRTPEERPRTPEEKNIVKFNPDELEDFMENIAIKSIQKYKEQKKAKEKKKAIEKQPSPKRETVRPPNPINNIIKPQWTEEELYEGFF